MLVFVAFRLEGPDRQLLASRVGKLIRSSSDGAVVNHLLCREGEMVTGSPSTQDQSTYGGVVSGVSLKTEG